MLKMTIVLDALEHQQPTTMLKKMILDYRQLTIRKFATDVGISLDSNCNTNQRRLDIAQKQRSRTSKNDHNKWRKMCIWIWRRNECAFVPIKGETRKKIDTFGEM